MPLTSDTLLHFSASLALLAGLVVFCGPIRRFLPGPNLAAYVFGAAFGVVAAAQMHGPLELAPGLIVDLRSLPIVLSGAFLGLRAVLVTMAIAIAARFMVGGIGFVPGVLGIMLTGGAGLLWDYLTTGQGARGYRAFLGLAALTSLHLFAVVLLPAAIAWWFLLSAGPVLILAYIVLIPLLAAPLEADRLAAMREAHERRTAIERLPEVLPGPESMARDLAAAEAQGVFRSGVTTLVLRLSHRPLRLLLWGRQVERGLLCGLHGHLSALLPRGSVCGRLRDDIILVHGPAMAEAEVLELSKVVASTLSTEKVSVPGMAATRLRCRVHSRRFQVVPSFGMVLEAFGYARKGAAARRPISADDAETAPGGDVSRLFQTTERLIEACEIDRRFARGPSVGL